MRKVIKEARSVEEALDLACQELGVERDAIDFEIVTLPKRGFLGLRNTPAKVRVFIEEPEAPAPRKREERPEKKENTGKQQRQEPRREPKKQELRVEKSAPKAEVKPEQAAEPKPESKPEPAEPQPPLEFVAADTVEGKARTAADYVKSVLAEMGVAAEISVAFTDNGIVMRLSGEGLGVIIGRRGETLDALQYLSGLVANRQEGDYMRVTIDSGNYREKRERTLQQLARKLSASAVRYGRPSTLEPMNPYERRIIHSTVSGIEGVTSSSIGEEPNRRVVISPTNPRPQQRGGKGRGPRPGGAGGSRPPRRDGRPGEGRPRDDRPRDDRPRDDRPRDDRRGGDRPPRRDGFRSDRGPRRDGAPRESVKPTPTDVDREYMKELEREPEHYVKPDSSEQAAQPRSEPARPAARVEEDLPLYGKIDL